MPRQGLCSGNMRIILYTIPFGSPRNIFVPKMVCNADCAQVILFSSAYFNILSFVCNGSSEHKEILL